MSKFSKEYQTFFESPAGLQFLTFITRSRDTEHEAAEDSPSEASFHAATAKAYRTVIEHIDSVTPQRRKV